MRAAPIDEAQEAHFVFVSRSAPPEALVTSAANAVSRSHITHPRPRLWVYIGQRLGPGSELSDPDQYPQTTMITAVMIPRRARSREAWVPLLPESP